MLMVSTESPLPSIVNFTSPRAGCHAVLGSIVTLSFRLPTEGTGGISALQLGGCDAGVDDGAGVPGVGCCAAAGAQRMGSRMRMTSASAG